MNEFDEPAVLTSRELRVLALVAEGQSAKGIGKQLGLSPRTVERLIENCRFKLNARNKANLISRAMAGGYLTRP